MAPSLALQPGGPPRNQAQALRGEMYQTAEANDPAMAQYLAEVRRRRNEALPQEAPRTLPPSDIGDITAALPSAPPQEALEADVGIIQFYRQVDQMTATEYEAGRFLWPSQALSMVMVQHGYYLEPLGSSASEVPSPPPPPAIEENLVDF